MAWTNGQNPLGWKKDLSVLETERTREFLAFDNFSSTQKVGEIIYVIPLNPVSMKVWHPEGARFRKSALHPLSPPFRPLIDLQFVDL